MYRFRETCRACQGKTLTKVLDLGIQPLANEFLHTEDEHSGYAPLQVMFCETCTLAQLSVVVDPKILYANYAYTTSHSRTMLRHFDQLAEDIASEGARGSVVEIGSNDGTLLLNFSQRGFGPVVGVDPAQNLAEVAYRQGFSTIVRNFDASAVNQIHAFLPKVDIVVARHVFAHIDDWQAFLNALDLLTHPQSLVCIEVPNTDDMLRNSEFDTVYHEHLSYVTIRAVEHLCRFTRWHIHRVIRYPIHGGVNLLMLRRNGAAQRHASVEQALTAERVTLSRWVAMAQASDIQRLQLKSLVRSIRDEGKTVCGFGASAKSSVWVNACRFTERDLDFITDTTPQKIGRFSPGSRIPIVHQAELGMRKPDYAVMFAWNYREEILSDQRQFMENGGRFIIPVPNIQTVGCEKTKAPETLCAVYE